VISFAPSHDSDGATTVYVQSLQERRTTHIALPRPTLKVFTPEPSSSTALLNPRTNECVFIDQLSPSPVTLLAHSGASEFVVIPVYDLNDDPRATWQIGFSAATSAPTLTTVKTLNPLPTPPASPRPKPRQSVSFVLPLDEQPKQQQNGPETMSSPPNGNISASNEDPSSSPLPSPSPDSPGATSLALLRKAQQGLLHHAQVVLGDGRLFATFSILAWLVGVFIRRIFRTFLPLGVQSRFDDLVWYLLPRPTGYSYAQRRRRIERRRRADSNGKGGDGESSRLSKSTSDINSGVSTRAESSNTNGSAREETTTHLFIDPIPLTMSPGTIESAEISVPSPLSYFAPSKSESTKAARWEIPVVENRGDSGTEGPNSTLHLLVRKPLVSGGAAAPHDALYVEVDGREYPLGPDLLHSNQGRRALKKANAVISDDPAASTSLSGGVSVYAVCVPEAVQAKVISVLVRLRA